MSRPPRRQSSRMSRSGKLNMGSMTAVKSRSSTGSTYLTPLTKIRTQRQIADFKKDFDLDDHIITLEELVARYSTDIENGLYVEQADQLLQREGPNCLVATAKKSQWNTLFQFLFGGFNMLLWIGAVLVLTEYGISRGHGKEQQDSLITGLFLIGVNLFTGLFGFYQEKVSSDIMEGFLSMVPKFATVIRGGLKRYVPSEELVLGDLIEINGGDIVPADIRIITSRNLQVDNSAITGESYAVNRSSDCTDNNPLETQNLAFYGTSVVQGSGTGIVVKCGDDTVIGRIAGLTSTIEKDESLIRKELHQFVKIISFIALCIGVTFFAISMLTGYGFFRSLSYCIALMMANVPEGLPICLTVSLSLTAKRMASNNCLVKKLQSIETLGSCTVICSDKTGTLTQNRMTVSHMFYDFATTDVLLSSDHIDKESETYQALCTVATLCSRATFLDGWDVPIEKRKIIGDASEAALLRYLEKMEGNVEARRNSYPKVCEIPFNSINKYQVSIHYLTLRSRFLLVMKGAPERVLDRCSTILRHGEDLSLNPQHLKTIRRAITSLGYKGERVLAFADLHLSEKYSPSYAFNADIPNFPLNGLRFIGLVSMVDPPKPSVPEAVLKCKSAGIRIIMVTGDHPVTASAIARKVGIISPNALSVYDIAVRNEVSLTKITENERMECTAAVVTGSDLKDMNEDELENILTNYQEIVFARTSPQQKLKIVEALQSLNNVVAVTGDGVNDSPALKKADIGVSMGITGSDVSKDAADIIILDDNFASIVTGIEEGRVIFDNLKKSVAYALTSNIPEIVPIVMMMVINVPEALGIITMLVIDVGTDLWPCISLAYEKPESDIMNRKPRDAKTDKLINRRMLILTFAQIGVIQALASFGAYFMVMAEHGFFWDRLIGIRPQWENPEVNDLTDSYGQNWTYEQRQKLTRMCITGYFLALNVTQIADLLVCKTRRLSLFQQGMTNHVLNAGLMFQICLAGAMVFCPVVNTALQFEPIHLSALLPTLPFALFIILYDEIRKVFVRKFPQGFIANETYY